VKTSTVLIGLIVAGVGVLVIKRLVTPKPTVGSAAGEIVDGTKNLIDALTRTTPPGVGQLGDSPNVRAGGMPNSNSYTRLTEMQPLSMTPRDRQTAGGIRGSRFGMRPAGTN
jgi:hypothetical protein